MPEKRSHLSDRFGTTDPEHGFDGWVITPPVPRKQDRLLVELRPDTPYAPGEVASRIATAHSGALFLADSSFFDEAFREDLWPTLLSVEDRVAIVPQVRDELGGWLIVHPDHPAAAALCAEHSLIREIDPGTWSDDDVRAATYYVQLLDFRKKLYRLAELASEEDLGRDLDAHEMLSAKRRVARDYGPRGTSLAKKGGEVRPVQRYTDEILVVVAFFHAISTGRETIVLTRDQDVLEQFYKMQWLLDTHYRAHLMADAYIADLPRTQEMPRGAPWTDAFQGDRNRLFERTDADLERVLPEAFSPVKVECWLLRDSETLISFAAEREMERVIATKGRTGGLSTERLLPRNCHIWLGPLDVPERFRGCCAIAEDRRLQMKTIDVAIPMLDAHQALMTGERFKAVRRSPLAI